MSTRPLVPSEPAELLVAIEGEQAELEGLSASAGRVVGTPQRVYPGVWRVDYDPPTIAGDVVFTVSRRAAPPTVHTVPVQAVEASALRVPKRVEALVGQGAVEIPVHSDGGRALGPLQVAVSEGQVAVAGAGDDLVVRLNPEASRFARFIPLFVRDPASGGAPTWVDVRLRARPVIAIQSEVGATMVLQVAGRSYGPVTADEEGILRVTIDHYPGELDATALIHDDVGNELSTPLPLPSNPAASLVVMATGEILPGQPPPAVYVRALRGNGAPWSGREPSCRSSAFGELVIVAVAPGVWRAQLPRIGGDQLRDVEVYCGIRGVAEAHVRVPLAREIASALHVDVFPDEVSADFPVAEIQAYLEDPQGGRLPTTGVQLYADHGTVQVEPDSGVVLRATYRGGRVAVDSGEDRVTATLIRPTSAGPVASLELLWGGVDDAGRVHALARAVDREGAPVGGVAVRLDAGGEGVVATTGVSGWAQASLRRAEGASGPVRITARAVGRERRLLALATTPAQAGFGGPDLQVSRAVRVTSGRVSAVNLTVDPPLLYLTPGAVAFVTVSLLDRYGRPVDDLPVVLDASDGTVGPPVLQADGTTWRAEYTPAPGESARKVTLSARSVEGEAVGEVQLVLTPRPLERSLSVFAGGYSNFGSVNGGLFGVEVEALTPLSSALFLRVGVANSVHSYEAQTPFGGPQTVQYLLFPVVVGVTRRVEMSNGTAIWGGGGAVTTPYRKILRFGQPVGAGWTVSPPGMAAWGGYGKRFGGAELGLEARYMLIQANAGASGLDGQIGGLAGVGTVRVLF